MANKNDKGYWFSLENGKHIHVGEGETPKQATEKALNKAKSNPSKQKNVNGSDKDFPHKRELEVTVNTLLKEGKNKEQIKNYLKGFNTVTYTDEMDKYVDSLIDDSSAEDEFDEDFERSYGPAPDKEDDPEGYKKYVDSYTKWQNGNLDGEEWTDQRIGEEVADNEYVYADITDKDQFASLLNKRNGVPLDKAKEWVEKNFDEYTKMNDKPFDDDYDLEFDEWEKENPNSVDETEKTNYKNLSETDVDKYFDKLNSFNPNKSVGERNQLSYDKEFFKEALKYDDPKKQFIEHSISRFGSKNRKDDEQYYSNRFDEIVEGISQGDNLQDPIQNDKNYINAVNKFKSMNKSLPKDYEETKEAMKTEVFDKYNNETNKSDELWKEKYEPILDAYFDLSNTYFKYGKYKNK